MFSKLLNLVSNQLVKGYNTEKEPKGQAGTGGLWRLYDGTKQGTNEPVSVFVIDKKTLKKGEKDDIIKQAKKEPLALAKFKHPGILSLCQPLVEDQNILAFVTQRIEGNLQLLLKAQRYGEICSSELEIRIQLLPLLETVNFIHSNVKIAHLAINPENVYVMPDGKWKLSGLGCSQPLNTNSSVTYQGKLSDLSYVAPEIVLQDRCCYTSDTFSVMVLVLNLVRTANKKDFRQLITASTKQEYERHKEILMRMESNPYVTETTNPQALARIVREALQWEPQRRTSIQHFIQSDWMNDDFILTIKHLEAITDLEQKRQLDFIKGMEEVLFRFETGIVKKRVIPALVNLLKFDYLIAVVLIVIVEILKKDILNAGEFQKTLFTPIKTITQSKEIPAHALYVLVDNIDLWAKFMSLTDLNSTVMPLYIKCFDCPNKLKELALKKVEFLSRKFDYQFLKTKLLPRLLNMMGDKTYDIRKYALIALYKIMALFDSQTISDQILVGLEKNRRMGTDPFTNAITLRLYSQFSKNLSIEVIGNKIIPSLIPYLSDPSITKNDFEMYKSTIMSLISRIQEERSKNFSVAEGVYFTEADYDFPKEERPAERASPQQPNFQFLSSFKEQPQYDNSPVQPLNQSRQPVQANSGGLDFGLTSTPTTGYTPPAYTPPPVVSYGAQQPFKYETPKVAEPVSNGLSGFDFLGSNSTSTGYQPPRQPEPSYTAPISKPSQQKKPLGIQEAADDFFAGLDDPKPEPPKPAFQFKGPSPKLPSSTTINPIMQPQPIQLNIPAQQHMGFSITMNTGGQVDPFAELQSELKRNQAPVSPVPPPNYQDLQLLSDPPQPPKPVIKKPAPPPSKPPTTSVAAINNDDFFDLL